MKTGIRFGNHPFALLALFLVACSSGPPAGSGTPAAVRYSDEAHAVLGRGVVSYLERKGHAVLSWRLLPADAKGVIFNVYRKKTGTGEDAYEKIGSTGDTFFEDGAARGSRYSYAVRAVQDGVEGSYSRQSIALSPVDGKAALTFDVGRDYKQARVATGDLDGDGEPEVVVAYSGYPNVDPYEKAHSKSGDTVKVAAFRASGERLWTLDLGWGIEAGLNFQPMLVSDLNGDGRAEVILKTNASGDPLYYEADRVTVLDGRSGRVKMEATWPSLAGLGSDYNNDSRNYLAIAHLDGKDPYVIAVRGLYKAQRMSAFDKNLHRVWERNLGLDHFYPTKLKDRLIKFWNIEDKWKYLWGRLRGNVEPDLYRGSHSLPVADVDQDGKEEILWGERCIGEHGRELWAIKENMPYRGHPDIVFPAKILPGRKGMQVFFGREGWGEDGDKIGVYLVDSGGRLLWARWGYHHIDRGWVGKIVPGHDGMECLDVDIAEKVWSKERVKLVEPTGYLWDDAGKLLGHPPSSWYFSFPVDWDGDGVREICIMESGALQKYGAPAIATFPGNCLWGADLLGDHREEIVAAPGNGKIYIFVNTGARQGKPRITPLADRQYRNDLTRTAMHGYVIPTEGEYVPPAATR